MVKIGSGAGLGVKKLDRNNLLEDAGLPKGRVKSALKSYMIASSHYNKTPQAVIKVTSYLSGVTKSKDHHSYISRNGEVELETETGEILQGLDEINDVIDEWRVDYSRKKEIKLDTYKIGILNKDPDKTDYLYREAKEYAKKYFNDYQIRIDKGTYDSNKNSIFISIKQTNSEIILPVIEDVKERFELIFKDNEVKVNLKQKQFNRDVVNIMMSAPKGSDANSVKIAVRNTAKEYFGDNGYRYVFALHDPDNDKHTKNPHVHLSIKMVNEITGKKLVLNPKDLISLRTLYAKKSKEQGINMSVSSCYERGVVKKTRSIAEIKLTEKEKIKGNNLRNHKQLAKDINANLKHAKNPVFKKLSEYRKAFKTIDEFIKEAKSIKNQSFNEPNKAKKHYLIQLHKALSTEADRLSKSKIQTLNETVRNKYKDDAIVLKQLSELSPDAKEKKAYMSMAKTVERYSIDMPKALTNKEKLLNVVTEQIVKDSHKQLEEAKSKSKNSKNQGQERE